MDGMDSELANLMPHNLDREGLLASPADTAELREYIQAHAVLGERGNLPQRVDSPSKMRAPDLGARVGTGRAPQAKRFCIRIKRRDGAPPPPQQDVELNPEELKDALLAQALSQRRALLSGSLRAGTGRTAPRPAFALRVAEPEWPAPPLELDEPPSASRLARLAATPGSGDAATGVRGRSPIEGVPEREFSLPSARGASPPGGAPMDLDMEGAPELRYAAGPALTAVASNGPAPRSGSPVAGLVREAAAPGALPPPPADAPVGDDDDDDFGGFDGEWGGDEGGWGSDDAGAGAAPAPPAFAAPAPRQPRGPPRPRRAVLDPGCRLRAELPRKSMAIDPHTGRQEVAPGVQRSTRACRVPLMWWLGERKTFSRAEHLTMPTVASTQVTADPGTPWRTVPDPLEWRKERNRARAERRARGEPSPYVARPAPRAPPAEGGARKKKSKRGKKRAAPARRAAAESDDDGGATESEGEEEGPAGAAAAPPSPDDSDATEALRQPALGGADAESSDSDAEVGGGGAAAAAAAAAPGGAAPAGQIVIDLFEDSPLPGAAPPAARASAAPAAALCLVEDEAEEEAAAPAAEAAPAAAPAAAAEAASPMEKGEILAASPVPAEAVELSASPEAAAPEADAAPAAEPAASPAPAPAASPAVEEEEEKEEAPAEAEPEEVTAPEVAAEPSALPAAAPSPGATLAPSPAAAPASAAPAAPAGVGATPAALSPWTALQAELLEEERAAAAEVAAAEAAAAAPAPAEEAPSAAAEAAPAGEAADADAPAAEEEAAAGGRPGRRQRRRAAKWSP